MTAVAAADAEADDLIDEVLAGGDPDDTQGGDEDDIANMEPERTALDKASTRVLVGLGCCCEWLAVGGLGACCYGRLAQVSGGGGVGSKRWIAVLDMWANIIHGKHWWCF